MLTNYADLKFFFSIYNYLSFCNYINYIEIHSDSGYLFKMKVICEHLPML